MIISQLAEQTQWTLWKPHKARQDKQVAEQEGGHKNYNTRHKFWNTCVIFPFLNVDLGITVVSLLQNTRGSTLGKERRKFKWERRCQECM